MSITGKRPRIIPRMLNTAWSRNAEPRPRSRLDQRRVAAVEVRDRRYHETVRVEPGVERAVGVQAHRGEFVVKSDAEREAAEYDLAVRLDRNRIPDRPLGADQLETVTGAVETGVEHNIPGDQDGVQHRDAEQ